MKNYYEILEIDKNASDEIIKVAYKSLVKKYHPDLKEGQEKTFAEEKIKEINDAYDCLSNPEKKWEYDQNLINKTISEEEYILILNENKKLKEELNYLKNNYNRSNRTVNYENNNFNNNYYHTNANYHTQQDNYYNSNNNNNYYSENKKNIFKNLNEKFKNIIAFLITFFIFFVLLNVPFIKDFFVNLFGSGYLIIFIVIVVFYFYFFKDRN